MKLYIAGPMTGMPDWNYPAFFAAEKWLDSIGIFGINPARTDGENLGEALARAGTPETAKPWGYYLRRALLKLSVADGLLLLPGWEKSKGARLEVHVARELGMPLYIEQERMLRSRVTVMGLSGYARAGKDTVGQIILNLGRGWERMSFADPMREALYRLNPTITAGGVETTLAGAVNVFGWEKLKSASAQVRPLMQRLGTEVGREMFGKNFWVDYALDNLPDGAMVVFTDVRFPNEADAIKALGGEVWRVNRQGFGAANAHESETAMDDYEFDYVIDNDSTLNNLEDIVAHGLKKHW